MNFVCVIYLAFNPTDVPQAGIIEEMLEDTLEGMEDEEEMEEAAEAEVDKILFEITAGKEPHKPHPRFEML